MICPCNSCNSGFGYSDSSGSHSCHDSCERWLNWISKKNVQQEFNFVRMLDNQNFKEYIEEVR